MPAAPDPANAGLAAPPGASLHPDIGHVTALLEYAPEHAPTAATERGNQAVGRDAAHGGDGEPAGHNNVSMGRGDRDGDGGGRDDVSVGGGGRGDGDGGNGGSAVCDAAPDGWLSAGFVPPDGGPLPEDWFPSAEAAVGPGGGPGTGTGTRGYLDPEETG